MNGDSGCTAYARYSMSLPRHGTGAAAAAHLLFVTPAFLREVDAHDPRRELREEPGGADHANQIGDGKSDRDAVGHRGRRRRREGRSRAMASLAVPIVADSVSDPAMTPAAVAGIVAEEPADDVGDDEAGRRHDRRQRRLLQAVALQAAEELRSGPEADREQEQQEEALLDFARHLNAQLADGDAGEERAGDGAEREASQLQLSQQVAECRARGRTSPRDDARRTPMRRFAHDRGSYLRRVRRGRDASPAMPGTP